MVTDTRKTLLVLKEINIKQRLTFKNLSKIPLNTNSVKSLVLKKQFPNNDLLNQPQGPKAISQVYKTVLTVPFLKTYFAHTAGGNAVVKCLTKTRLHIKNKSAVVLNLKKYICIYDT